MAEFPTKRIVNLDEQSEPQSGDYIVTDNQTSGTKKTPASALAKAAEVDEIKDELSVLVTDETMQSSWSFSTSTNAGVLNTVRFSASICAEESNLESVSIKTRNEDSGSVSICLAEISGTSATIYAVIPITLHASPATNIEYINGVDFNYSDKVRANTIFGVWADHSVQVNFGTETVKSYATTTETPLNHTFSVSAQNNYNVAVAFKATVKVPIAQATTKVVVFGDSWTDIVNTTYTRWPVLINELDGFDVTSYGVTGSAISSHVADQVNNFLTASATADVFIMMGGINDYRGGTAYTSIVSAVQGYYASLHEAYPNARFIYLANNQLFYSQDQLKYFNKIIAELRRAGIECYTMYGWVYPNQYNTTDLLHVGNAGNKLIANNILSLLRGGTIATVLNFVNYTYVENGVTIGNFDVFEEWYDGLPKITIQGIASSTLAGKTFTKTLSASALYLGVSASYVVYPIQRNDRSKYITVYTPVSETLDSNKQITTFELTFVANSAGATYVTEGCPRWYA